MVHPNVRGRQDSQYHSTAQRMEEQQRLREATGDEMRASGAGAEGEVTMASHLSTMPPAPMQSSAQASVSSGPVDSSIPGVDMQAVGHGLDAAQRAGVDAAKRTFWGKLAGSLVLGLGLVAFGLATGGVGPLAVAGLALTGAFFVKSCADTHMARLNLENAREIAAGRDAPHFLPCGADALANLLYQPFLSRAMRGVDTKKPDAVSEAHTNAKRWAIGISMGVELSMGIAATAVSGAALGNVGLPLAALGLRILAHSLTMVMSEDTAQSPQEESIEIARNTLNHVDDQLNRIDLGEPPQDPEGIGAYRFNQDRLVKLRLQAEEIRDWFEQQLQAFESGLGSITPHLGHAAQTAMELAADSGARAADLGLSAGQILPGPIAPVVALVRTATQAAISLRNISRQEALEEQLTTALLSLDEQLVDLSSEAAKLKLNAAAPQIDFGGLFS